MKKLEWFIKRKEEAEQELAKLAGNLNKLNENRQQLENEINNAIDEEKLSVVEKLTAQEAELDNRIRAAEKILNRKQEKAFFSREDLAEANNAEMDKCQADFDSAMAATVDIKRQYYTKIFEAAKIARDARSLRYQYLKLAGDENPRNFQASNKDFKGIKSLLHLPPELPRDDVEMLREIDPQALEIIRSV